MLLNTHIDTTYPCLRLPLKEGFMKRFRLRWAAISALTLLVPASVWATNGMDLEGYGPIALGMGGASLAYDNGTAAVMNNPATLGLMAAGSTRIDLALGKLGPDVSASVITPQGRIRAGSLAKAFYMAGCGHRAAPGSSHLRFGRFWPGRYGHGIFGLVVVGRSEPRRQHGAE
jgi:long-chain fatty acid transport protein